MYLGQVISTTTTLIHLSRPSTTPRPPLSPPKHHIIPTNPIPQKVAPPRCAWTQPPCPQRPKARPGPHSRSPPRAQRRHARSTRPPHRRGPPTCAWIRRHATPSSSPTGCRKPPACPPGSREVRFARATCIGSMALGAPLGVEGRCRDRGYRICGVSLSWLSSAWREEE
jgi:hypothetical protein